MITPYSLTIHLLLVAVAYALVRQRGKSRRLAASLDDLRARESRLYERMVASMRAKYSVERENRLLRAANGSLFEQCFALGVRVVDLVQQRTGLGDVIEFTCRELEASERELRSANRRLLAATAKAERLEREARARELRDAADEVIERLFGPSSRQRARGSALEITDLTIDCGSENFFVRGAQTNDGRKVIVSALRSKPAPLDLTAHVMRGRVKFTWDSRATSNSDVEFSINGKPWRSFRNPNIREALFILPKGETSTLAIRNVWPDGTKSLPVSTAVTVPAEAA